MKRTKGLCSVIKEILSPLLLLFHSTMAIPNLFPKMCSSPLQEAAGTKEQEWKEPCFPKGATLSLLLDEELQKRE